MKSPLLFLFTLFLISKPLYAFDRIVSIGGSITETLYALGEGEKIVGVDATSIYPQEAKEKAQLGYRHAINIEGILSLKPDIIFASDKYLNDALARKLKTLELNLVLIKEEESKEGIISKIQILGKTVSKMNLAEKLINKIEKDFLKAKSLQPEINDKKVVFIYARGGNRIFLSGKKTPAHKMIKLAGVTNSFSKVEGFKPITAESLLLSNPDAIVMLKSGAKSLKDGPWSIKGLSKTKAGKNKSLIVVDDLAFLGFGPRTGESLIDFIGQLQKI